jgi:3-(3-hydroxy-phenyl)propionate hydroxylase
MGVTEKEVDIHQHAFYKHHIRRAERWRDGRVFLVGDAAHLMPPWTGQGMQSGIRDAFNLCWKIIEVLKGSLPDAVLDSYEPERAPDVERYTQIAVALGRLIKQELSDEEIAAMQPPPGGEPPPSPLLEAPVLLAGWLNGDPGPMSAVGKYIPQPRAARSNGTLALLDDIIGNGFVLLGDNVDPTTLLDADQRLAWDQLGAAYHAVRSPDQWSDGPADIIDLEGTLLAWMRGFCAKVVAVRPDRFVAASDAVGLSVPSGRR